MLSPERHDLLRLSDEGLNFAWEHRETVSDDDDDLRARYRDIPAIFTGAPPKGKERLLRVGFSYPVRVSGVRRRIAAYIKASHIREIITPWEALAAAVQSVPGPAGDFIRGLRDESETLGARIGLFGSAALQAVTGYGYIHKDSDLDIVFDRPEADAIMPLAETVSKLSAMSGIASDAEIRLDRDHYIKIRELISGQTTVMSKGGKEPQLLSVKAVWDYLRHAEIK